ncbi:hypothetical protein ARGLB_051_01210 [Arthrobacter globiformis NBRC 12137]|uniref:Uncharacterized protein n=1 Tax=Arthrobacter globiformis (strain ATCC 8010 / DSM 20124 / JCM 1332 / NBRC 12137 / NCIMB 8907 / NRRL B-2979 / 168) TaxID=1077972 RepID=H0QM89_ARTG1|nr:hypothetical protein ARGLB_051_01210 [Arthrobacter globiformis NBRC 12137]
MPVHVVFSDVEADAGDCRDRLRPVQLEAGEFHREDVILHRVTQGVEDRRADVAHGDRLQACGPQHGLGQADRRRFAVGAGDGEPVSCLPAFADAQSPGEFDVAPDRDVGAGGGREQSLVRAPARRSDHEVRLQAVDLWQRADGILTQENVGRAHDPQRVRLGLGCFRGGAVDHHHAGTEFDQRVRSGEARDADPGDHDAQPGPVGVPANQAAEPRRTGYRRTRRHVVGFGAVHSRTTHSA